MTMSRFRRSGTLAAAMLGLVMTLVGVPGVAAGAEPVTTVGPVEIDGDWDVASRTPVTTDAIAKDGSRVPGIKVVLVPHGTSLSPLACKVNVFVSVPYQPSSLTVGRTAQVKVKKCGYGVFWTHTVWQHRTADMVVVEQHAGLYTPDNDVYFDPIVAPCPFDQFGANYENIGNGYTQLAWVGCRFKL